jgi:hypothetical protein
VRALSEQQAVVDNLRSRAGVLFSTAAITTSFLGARASQGELSFQMHRSYLKNCEEQEKLIVFFQLSNLLFAFELVLWVAAIAFIA